MKENHDYLMATQDSKSMLKGQILMLQLRGAKYAAAFCLIIVLAILALAWIGNLLPEDSRFTPDPTPLSFYMKNIDVLLV